MLLETFTQNFCFTKKYFDGKVPEYLNPSAEDESFENAIKELPDKVGEYISQFEFREALLEIFKVAKKEINISMMQNHGML